MLQDKFTKTAWNEEFGKCENRKRHLVIRIFSGSCRNCRLWIFVGWKEKLLRACCCADQNLDPCSCTKSTGHCDYDRKITRSNTQRRPASVQAPHSNNSICLRLKFVVKTGWGWAEPRRQLPGQMLRINGPTCSLKNPCTPCLFRNYQYSSGGLRRK